jgi:hypothetical protein
MSYPCVAEMAHLVWINFDNTSEMRVDFEKVNRIALNLISHNDVSIFLILK